MYRCNIPVCNHRVYSTLLNGSDPDTTPSLKVFGYFSTTPPGYLDQINYPIPGARRRDCGIMRVPRGSMERRRARGDASESRARHLHLTQGRVSLIHRLSATAAMLS